MRLARGHGRLSRTAWSSHIANEHGRWVGKRHGSRGLMMRPGATSGVIPKNLTDLLGDSKEPHRVIPKNLTDLLDELGIGAMQHKVTLHHSECGRTLRDHFVACYLLAEEWGNSKDVVGTRGRERQTHRTTSQGRNNNENMHCVCV